jgi:hypothetical protein
MPSRRDEVQSGQYPILRRESTARGVREGFRGSHRWAAKVVDNSVRP